MVMTDGQSSLCMTDMIIIFRYFKLFEQVLHEIMLYSCTLDYCILVSISVSCSASRRPIQLIIVEDVIITFSKLNIQLSEYFHLNFIIR